MSCNDLFFVSNNTDETLHQRTQLSNVVLSKGITKKNELIEFLRPELSEAFECKVRFWLQGSYKSQTLLNNHRLKTVG